MTGNLLPSSFCLKLSGSILLFVLVRINLFQKRIHKGVLQLFITADHAVLDFPVGAGDLFGHTTGFQ